MTRPPRFRPSERLSRALSVIACLSFVLGVRDTSRLRPIAAAVNFADPTPQGEPERPGSLVATVVTESGRPIMGATVQGFWEHDARFHFAGAGASDSLGRASLSRLPEGRLWVLAEASGFARSSSALVLAAGARSLTLTLHPARTLAVTVLDEREQPIAGATVLVEAGDPLPFGALSDTRGVAQFRRLGASPWSVKASAAGYESVAKAGVVGAVGALTLALRRLASLEVRVLNTDGKPAADATVMIAGATLWPARSARTGPLGNAQISGLLAGNYDLRASLENAVAPTRLGYALTRGANESVTLQLEPGRSVVALVTDGEGDNPLLVPNADVVLAERGLGSFPIRGRTGGDGRVVLGPIASGPASLGARADDFVSSALVVVPEVLTGPVRVPLLRGATVHGTVRDARGFAVDGASIEVVGSDASGLPIAETPALVGFRQNHFAWSLSGPLPLIPAGELGVMPGPVPPIPRLGASADLSFDPGNPEPPAPEPAPWVSDRAGRFTARPVTPGRVRVIVRHPDYVEGTSAFVSVDPGGQADVEITLLKGGALEGRVVDEREHPLSDVQVEIGSPSATLREVARTASDGTFAFAAVPAEVALSLSRAEEPSRVVFRKSLHVPEGSRQTLSLVLPTAREAVRIVVVDEDDRPIELTQLTVTSLEPTRPMRLTRFTDAEGAVSIDDALGENLRLVAEAPGFSRAAQTLAQAPKEIRLTLLRGVIVEGRVTSVRGRRPVAGALLTLQQEGMRQTAQSDSGGVFRFRDVSPGDIRLRVEHPDFASEEAVRRVASTGRADRAFTLPDIDLSEAGEVEGDVLTERGDPVPGARVGVGDLATIAPVGKALVAGTLSDTSGHFLLRAVHPGPVTVSAFSSVSGGGSTPSVDVVSGRTTRGLRIVLTAGDRESDGESLAPGTVAVTLGERGAAPNVDVVVLGVAEGSEAERAGIRSGDVLRALDGEKPNSLVEARDRLAGQPGTDLVLEIERAGVSSRYRVLRELLRR